jgi:hypothetical protein
MFRKEIEKTVTAQPCELSSHYFRYGPFCQRNDFFWVGGGQERQSDFTNLKPCHFVKLKKGTKYRVDLTIQ